METGLSMSPWVYLLLHPIKTFIPDADLASGGRPGLTTRTKRYSTYLSCDVI